jgi:hypothetical protein
MKKTGSIWLWIAVFLGFAVWVRDIVTRVQEASNPWTVWRVLLFWFCLGALLEVLFLVAGFLMRRSPHLWSPFGHWAGAFYALLVVALAGASWVFDRADPLSPMAFVAGFTLTWLAAGGHRQEFLSYGSSHARADTQTEDDAERS